MTSQRMKEPSKARVRFPDADGNGEWQEVEVRDFNAFVEAFIKTAMLNHQRKCDDRGDDHDR